MYDFGIHLRPVLMERRLERCQNDVQLWRVTRFWRQYHKARRHLWVSNSWHFFVHSRQQARPAQCNLQWWRLLFTQQQGRKRPNNVWSWGAAELHVERRLERRQNDVQLWRAARVWRRHHKTRRHLWVSNYRHYIYSTFKTASKHPQHSAICWAARWNARAANRSLFPLLPDLLGSKLERPGTPTWEEAPKLCLVLRTGWAACGTTSGTTSRRRPGAGTLAHGNKQHHNAERASILAKKQQHECSCTWKQK